MGPTLGSPSWVRVLSASEVVRSGTLMRWGLCLAQLLLPLLLWLGARPSPRHLCICDFSKVLGRSGARFELVELRVTRPPRPNSGVCLASASPPGLLPLLFALWHQQCFGSTSKNPVTLAAQAGAGPRGHCPCSSPPELSSLQHWRHDGQEHSGPDADFAYGQAGYVPVALGGSTGFIGEGPIFLPGCC